MLLPSPSERKKTGIHFDLPIGIAILLADKQLEKLPKLKSTVFFGGLSLDGQLQPITGSLILTQWAQEHQFQTVVLPRANYAEAALVEGVEIIPATSFHEVIEWLHDRYQAEPPKSELTTESGSFADDWLQIQGQQRAKRALLISASGDHNLLLEGPPGAGKTMLAKGLRALLPVLSTQERLDVIKLHSVANLLKPDQSVDAIARPFRSPHHSASQISIIGGGSYPKPGEISLAHRGVLYLDELAEFPRNVLEALRQPLEDGEIHVSRIAQVIRYPARFILVATMNPCPCGWLGSNQKECQCTPYQIATYRKKISGPILDRVDLYLAVDPVPLEQLRRPSDNPDSLSTWRQRIERARAIQRQRQGGQLNAYLSPKFIQRYCGLDQKSEELLEQAAKKFVITGRGLHKILKVARTIADLDGQEMINQAHLAEALQYRFGASNWAATG